jgi:hypothetical protein
MLHYEIDPAVLAPYVPAGVELDQWQGRSFVSLVAFQFLRTAIRGFPVPLHQNFEEMNLRCYTRRMAGQEARRGVVFIREVVPLPTISLAARLLYNEPYRTLPMRSRVNAGPPPTVEYQCHFQGVWRSCSGNAEGSAATSAVGSLEEFLVDRPWGHTWRRPHGATWEYRVEHPPWKLWAARDARLDAGLVAMYGEQLARGLEKPHLAFIADGSEVAVYAPSALA